MRRDFKKETEQNTDSFIPSRCRKVCPDCGFPKMQFETESKAKNFIKFNGYKLTDNVETLRTYYCPSCCCYHITSHSYKTDYDYRTSRMIDAYNKEKKHFKTQYTEVQMLKMINSHLNISGGLIRFAEPLFPKKRYTSVYLKNGECFIHSDNLNLTDENLADCPKEYLRLIIKSFNIPFIEND